MLFDTDVLIWCFRGNTKASAALLRAERPVISAVTMMELIQGARDKRELGLIGSFLADTGIATLPLSENIGHRATVYLEQHALKDGMAMADALIAATAREYGLALCTANVKHFRVVAELELVVFKP